MKNGRPFEGQGKATRPATVAAAPIIPRQAKDPLARAFQRWAVLGSNQ